jgi:hypothetical protein
MVEYPGSGFAVTPCTASLLRLSVALKKSQFVGSRLTLLVKVGTQVGEIKES